MLTTFQICPATSLLASGKGREFESLQVFAAHSLSLLSCDANKYFFLLCSSLKRPPFPILFLGCGLWSTQTASLGRALCLEGGVSAKAGCFTKGCTNQEFSLSLKTLGVAPPCRFLHSRTQPGTRQQSGACMGAEGIRAVGMLCGFVPHVVLGCGAGVAHEHFWDHFVLPFFL